VPLASPDILLRALRWLPKKNSPFKIGFPPNISLLRWLWHFVSASRSSDFEDRAALLTRMCVGSIALFHELQQNFAFDLKCSGTLEVFADEKGLRHFEKGIARLRKAGIGLEVISSQEGRTLAPFLQQQIAGCIYYPADCSADPSVFLQAIQGVVRRMGVEVREFSPIKVIHAAGRKITAISTNDETTEVAGVICAAGYESPAALRSLGVALPVQPARGYTIDLAADVHWPTLSVMFAEARLLATRLEDRGRIGGYLHLGKSPRVNLISKENLLHPLMRYVIPECLHVLNETAAPVWSGFRPCSPDGLPILGWSTRFNNLYLATGHGMLGLTLGPLSGKMAAEAMQGKLSAFEGPYVGPGRFHC
jgi:D-amino-acid dehydrogenase